MRAFVCIDGQNWERIVRGTAEYLKEGEAALAHVVDERAFQGYDLTLRGLLGRRSRRSEEEMAPVSREAAGELLADSEALLKDLCPGLSVKKLVLSGPPNEELARAAEGERSQTIYIGRGAPTSRARDTVSGTVREWKQNHRGEKDGLYLDDQVEVSFPPHQASEIQRVIHEGAAVEILGTWEGRHLHAYSITDSASGTSVEAHKTPEREPGKLPLGHTARFIVDHALCDVVVLKL